MQQKLHPCSLIALNAQKLHPIAFKSNQIASYTYSSLWKNELIQIRNDSYHVLAYFANRSTNRYRSPRFSPLFLFILISSLSFSVTRFDFVTDRVTLKINHVIFGAPIFFLNPRASLFKVFHSLFSFFSRRIIVE